MGDGIESGFSIWKRYGEISLFCFSAAPIMVVFSKYIHPQTHLVIQRNSTVLFLNLIGRILVLYSNSPPS